MSSFANLPLAECKTLFSENEVRNFKLSIGNNAYIQIEGLGQIIPQTGHRLDLLISMMNPVQSNGLIMADSRHPIFYENDNQFYVVISTQDKTGSLNTGDGEEILKLDDCEINLEYQRSLGENAQT